MSASVKWRPRKSLFAWVRAEQYARVNGCTVSVRDGGATLRAAVERKAPADGRWVLLAEKRVDAPSGGGSPKGTEKQLAVLRAWCERTAQALG
jgi:hypothetical protein